MKENTAILLATYNGERYLKEQLDSLYAQTYKDWMLYVHDDGSTDNTMYIVHDYAKRYDNIVILDYPSQHGAKANFFSLIKAVEADYYFFCDQDDKWCMDKIEKEMLAMRRLEQAHPDAPILVCSDAYITDEQLNITSHSLWRTSGRWPEYLTTFAEAGAIDFATGCTILFNKAVKGVIVSPMDKATMHDAWITLCVYRANGIVYPIREPLLYYRQHENNTLGAGAWERGISSYCHSGIIKILKKNSTRWKMLKALNYGSFMKFICYKIIYKYQRRSADKR